MELEQKRVNGKFGFETTNATGVKLRTDASEKVGGENFGFRPMELLASGLASCAAIDIILILEKQRQIVTDYSVKINATRSDEIPSIFTTIDLKIKIYGQIDQKKAEKAADLVFSKYCSVSKILEKSCEINHSIIVHPSI